MNSARNSRRAALVLLPVFGLLAAGAVTAEATVDPVIDPVVRAVPATGISDGDQITVALSGFHPNEIVGVTECATPPGWPEVCDFEHGVNFTTGPDGAAAGKIVARKTWTGIDPLTGRVVGQVDCGAPICTVGAASPVNHEGDVYPIRFK